LQSIGGLDAEGSWKKKTRYRYHDRIGQRHLERTLWCAYAD